MQLAVALKMIRNEGRAVQIALDSNPLYTTRAGVARYVRGLQMGLLENEDPDFEVRPWAWPVENFDYRQPRRMMKTVWRELVWTRMSGARQLRENRPDLLHSTALPLIAKPACPHGVTLHDLALLRYPERFRTWQRIAGLRRLRQLKHAEQIIAVSRFTADEAMKLLDLPAEKITVVPHGVTLASEERIPVDLPPEFFLFVGSLEPGKNLKLLREVWADANLRRENLPPLVIVGARWEGVPHEGAAPRDWHFLGHQPDEVLLALYRRARALLFPSRYEGFGMPLLEAMSAGCPVICGRVASLPEVGGDAALYAELSLQGLQDAIRLLANEEGLREDLCAKGFDRAGDFSWSRCARETAEVWRGMV